MIENDRVYDVYFECGTYNNNGQRPVCVLKKVIKMSREEYNISKEGMKRLLYLLKHPLVDDAIKIYGNCHMEDSEVVEFKDLDLSFIDKT